MFDVYTNTKKYEPVFLAVVNDQGKISGTLLAVIQKEYASILGNFTARSIIHGGPLIKDDDPNVMDFVLKEYNGIIKKKAIYSQFRNFWDWSSLEEVFLTNGFEFEEHLNILIDLTKSEDQLWKEVHSKRRNEIRRAVRENTTFSIGSTDEALEKCYDILKEVYSRAKLPIPDYLFFHNLFHMKENAKLMVFCAHYHGEIIGCMLALVFGDRIYDFYAGSLKEYYNKYPNDLIPWEVFKWGKDRQYRIFDFGGAGKPDIPYGVRDYKKKFGGEFLNFGRFTHIHKPFFMKVGKMGFYFYRLIKY